MGAPRRAFGLAVIPAFPLGELDRAAAPRPGDPEVRVELASAAEVAARWSGACDPPVRWATTIDDRPYAVERGAEGDHRFAFGTDAELHLDAAGVVLRCAPRDEHDPWWRRFLLDTVLATVAMTRGAEALHAAAVVTAAGAVALVGAQGAGKTTLALELRRRGHALLCDDVLVLDQGFGEPAPPVANVPSGAMLEGDTPLARLGDETWVAVAGAAVEPMPLAALVHVQRRPGPIRVDAAPDPAVTLLAHALGSGSRPERQARRFVVLAELAARVPLLRLTGDGPPAALADAVEQAVGAAAAA